MDKTSTISWLFLDISKYEVEIYWKIIIAMVALKILFMMLLWKVIIFCVISKIIIEQANIPIPTNIWRILSNRIEVFNSFLSVTLILTAWLQGAAPGASCTSKLLGRTSEIVGAFLTYKFLMSPVSIFNICIFIELVHSWKYLD